MPAGEIMFAIFLFFLKAFALLDSKIINSEVHVGAKHEVLGQGIDLNELEAHWSHPTMSLLFSQMHNAAAGPSACSHVPCAPAAHHL